MIRVIPAKIKIIEMKQNGSFVRISEIRNNELFDNNSEIRNKQKPMPPNMTPNPIYFP